MKEKKVLLMGNPNVGKSTVFNELTGMHQHTGNWTGKTVDSADGNFYYKYNNYRLIDLPGTYSLIPSSEEERVAGEYLLKEKYDCVVIVIDSTLLQRNLMLFYQILEITNKVVVMLNLCDEAKKRNIEIDKNILSNLLGVPVIKATARSGKGINELLEEIHLISTNSEDYYSKKEYDLNKIDIENLAYKAEFVTNKAVTQAPSKKEKRDEFIDKIILGKYTSIPIMLVMFGIILWITIKGSNYPSEILSSAFFNFEEFLSDKMREFGISPIIISLLIDGMLKVLLWVVAVMLPPMAIFFPLFTLLEDSGFLPRIAFLLDKRFGCAGACGKQALTMCMGFGCNAAGVTGCRIINSPRERFIAILTNSFVPCNGRFGTLIAIITAFFASAAGGSLLSAFYLTLLILAGVILTLLMSKLLSVTIFKGVPSAFTLELPPYRRPQILKVLIRSLLDRTIFVLGRACIVAAPAGLLLWIFATVKVGNDSILAIAADFLEMPGQFLGLDGKILTAFIMGFPANEIVMPIAVMLYQSGNVLTETSGTHELFSILTANGWTMETAVCMMVFMLFHFPCSTTCLTIKKETGSIKYMLIAMLLPTLCGIILCSIISCIFRIF